MCLIQNATSTLSQKLSLAEDIHKDEVIVRKGDLDIVWGHLLELVSAFTYDVS